MATGGARSKLSKLAKTSLQHSKVAARTFLKNPSWQVERFVLIAGLIFGLLFVILIPPMQGADEPNHFMRAYQISTGDLVSEKVTNSVGGINPRLVSYKNPNVGGTLPAGIVDFAQATYDFHSQPNVKMTDKQYDQLKHMTAGTKLKAAAFPNTAAYSPFAYLPSAAAIWLGRLFNASPMQLMYMARLAGLLVALAMIALAIRLLPFGKLPFAVIALLPMTISQLSVVSADTMAIATSFLAIALTLHYAFAKRDISIWQIVLLVGVYAYLGLNKQSLTPIALLNLTLLANPAIRQLKAIGIALGCIVAGLITSTLWNGMVKDLVVLGYHQTYKTSNYSLQYNFVTHHPLTYLRTLYQTFLTGNFTLTITSFIGDLGWLDTALPPFINMLGFGLIALAIFIASQHNRIQLPKWFRYLAAVSAVGVAVATASLLYLLSEKPEAKVIKGLQGRYFIPVALLLILAFIPGKASLPDLRYRVLSRRILYCSVILLSVMTYILFVRYYNAALVTKSLLGLS